MTNDDNTSSDGSSDETQANKGSESSETAPTGNTADPQTPPTDLPGDRMTDARNTDVDSVVSAKAIGDILDEPGAPDALTQSEKDDLIVEMSERNAEPEIDSVISELDQSHLITPEPSEGTDDTDSSDVDLSDLPGLEDEDDDLPDDSPADELGSPDSEASEVDEDRPQSKGSKLRQVGVGASLFMFALFGMWYLLANGDDGTPGETVTTGGDSVISDDSSASSVDNEPATDEATESEETGTSDDTSPADIGCGEAAADGVDSRFHVNCVDAMLDRQDKLWVLFPQGWGIVPPCCIKSGYFQAGVSYNPTVEIGWETHDGVETILGTPSEAYILDDGSVLFATGLSPTPPYQLVIDVVFASWQSDDDPVISGEYSTEIGSDSVKVGDPLLDLGGPPVFDLLAGEPLAGG